MSASLVGSEMCIRDSLVSLVACRAHRGTCAPSCQDVRWCLPPQSMRPVSYTHLTLPTICSV
eukprot:2360791-Alexandrium_andersonii.AAC.1